MKFIHFIIISLCVCASVSVLAQDTYQKSQSIESRNDTVYVSGCGDDVRGSGMIDSPFYSLNKAVEEKLSTDELSDTLFVLVAPGDYYMQEPFSIQTPSSRPVVIRSQGTEKPRFFGGICISNWEKCENSMYRAHIPEVAKYRFDFEQFYVNDQRAVLARTPNKEWFHVNESKEQTFVKGARIADYALQQVDFHPTDWNSLSKLSAIELKYLKFRFYHKWDITKKVPEYVEKDSARIYMGGKGMKPWNPIQRGSRYFMYDYKAALDSPGEWFLDRESGYIYYMPRDGENMNTAFCVAPVLHQWISIKGKQGRPVKNIRFENISFQYSSYMIPDEGEEPMQAAAYSEAAIQFDFSENIILENCELLHTGAYGVWLRQECHNNRISRCFIADLGAGGIKIGEPYFRISTGKVASGNIIDNNIITSAGHEQPCGVGVALFHTSDNKVTHNEISDILYSGVSVGWVWGYNQSSAQWVPVMTEKGEFASSQIKIESPSVRNSIMYNHIHHIGWGELSDMGAVYTLGESPGTCVSYNVIHDVFSYDYGGWGLYTDEGSTGVEMSYNLVYRCKSGGFHQHYGKDNKIVNNILALGYTNQLQCTRAEDHLSFTFLRNLILIEDEVLFKGNWETSNINADYNVYWSLSDKSDFCGKNFKEWKKSKEPNSVMMNPQFKNSKEGDFTFKSESVVKKVGFKPFDYSKSGVYGDKNWIQKACLSQKRQDDFSHIVNQYMLRSK